jgi:uncharacterized OB-fold protein
MNRVDPNLATAKGFEKLDDRKKEIFIRMSMRERIRMINNARKVTQKLCDDCGQKVFNNPDMPLERYCKKCQEEVRKIYGL